MTNKMSTIIHTFLRSDKRKNPDYKDYIPLTYAECLELKNDCLILDRENHVANVKITSIKTWKRKQDIEIHCKYGMYEYFTIKLSPEIDNTELVKEFIPETL
jgi:hypothetical protein